MRVSKATTRTRPGAKTVDPDELLTLALDASPYGVIVTGAALDDNPILYSNTKFRSLMGLNAAAELPSADLLIRTGTPGAGENKALRDAFSGAEPRRVVVRSAISSGEQFWNEIQILPSTLSQGVPQRYIAWCRRLGESEAGRANGGAEGPLNTAGDRDTEGPTDRQAFYAEYERLRSGMRRADDTMAVILFALDNAGVLRSSFGEQAVVAAMRKIEQIVGACLRRERELATALEQCKLGVLLPHCHLDQAHYIALTVCEKVRHSAVACANGDGDDDALERTISVTVSAGVAAASGVSAAGKHAVLELAETALERARDAGSDCARALSLEA